MKTNKELNFANGVPNYNLSLSRPRQALIQHYYFIVGTPKTSGNEKILESSSDFDSLVDSIKNIEKQTEFSNLHIVPGSRIFSTSDDQVTLI